MMTKIISKFKGYLSKNPLSKGAFYLMGSSSLGHMLAVLTFPILSRVYSPADIGLWSMFSSIMALIVVSVNLKFDMAIVTEANDEDANMLFWSSIIIGVPMALLFTLFFAGLIHFHMLAYGKFSSYSIGILLFAALVVAIFQPVWHYFLRQSNYKKLGMIHLTQKVGRLGTQIGLGILTQGYVGLLFSEALGRLLAIGYALSSIKIELWQTAKQIRLEKIKRVMKKRIDFPKFTMPAMMVSVLASIAAAPLLGFYFSAYEAGLYAIVYKILSLPVAILSNTMADVFYNESAKQRRDDAAKMHKLFVNTSKKIFLIAIIPLLGVEILGPYLFRTYLGAKWAPCGAVAQVLAPWLFLFTLVNSVNRVAIVIDKQWAKLAYDSVNFFAVCFGIIFGYALHLSFIATLTFMGFLCAVVNVVFYFLFYFLVQQYSSEGHHEYSISHSHS